MEERGRVGGNKFSTNHILAKVKEVDGFEWYLTCFYGWPKASQKEKSWKLLAHLKMLIDGLWLCIGDFNTFLSSSKKLSKRPPNNGQVEAFCEALDLCQLEDLGFKRYPLIWNNKRLGDANTKVRPDRAVVTKEWRVKYQLSSITHLSSHVSDHLPIILQIKSFSQNRIWRDRKFKFEDSWLLWDNCEAVVKEAWDQVGEEVAGLGLIKEKIKLCGEKLLAWGSTKTNPDTEEIK